MENGGSLKGSRSSLNKPQYEMEEKNPFSDETRETKANATEDEMVSIDMEGKVTEEQPSSKLPSEKAESVKSIDYKNRDPNNIHEDVKVNFADIIAEPSGAHSFATVWGTSYKVYSVTKYWLYRIMSLLCGIPISLFWGIYFSCLAFCSIWCITPCIRSFIIQVGFVGKIWGACVNTVLDPCFQSIGLVLSRVQVAMTVRRED